MYKLMIVEDDPGQPAALPTVRSTTLPEEIYV